MEFKLVMTKPRLKTLSVVAMFFLLSPVAQSMDYERQQIEKRIQPIGKVRIDGETNVPTIDKAQEEIEPAETTQKPVLSGKKVYDQYCMVCHRVGLAGAPKFRNEDDWKPRLAKKDIAALTQSAINGLNAMPARGTCSQCSDEEIQAAVEYMVPQQ